MSMDALKATFFAECEELVEAMTEGLQQIADDDWDSETVNAIFRAVHSIKGSAGAFGFESLVAFAHRYETVLDKIRSNTLGIDADVLRVITRASDVLAELVELAQVEP
ncbi:MAG: Hpt domain-containing protein, partial [Donghicola eburneus]